MLDVGYFLLQAWVLIVPYYVLKCEGRRGLEKVALFCLTYVAAWGM